MRHNHEMREFVPAPARTRNDEWSLLPTVGDLFQSFFQPSFFGSKTGPTLPAIDLKEKSDHYALTVDVPGYTMDQINVQFTDNVLTISGERTEEVTEKDEGKKDDDVRWHIVERSHGSFSRSIKFPVPVESTNVKAALKGGVLTITVPKRAEARAQKIKITEA